MDRYTVDVVVFGSDKIKESIDHAKPLERLRMNSISGDVHKISKYSQADLLIVDSSIGPACREAIIAQKAEYAEVILVVSTEECMAVEEDYSDVFYDVWIQDSPLLDYRIYALEKRLLGDLDAELGRKQLDVLIDSVPDLVWYKDVRGAHIKVNDTFCKTVNKTKEQIKDRGHCYIWDLDMAEYEQGEYVCMETEEVVIEEQKTFLFHEKVKIGDEMRQLNTYKSAILGRRGETVGTVGIAHDVTDMWNTHEEFKTLINNLPFPMMLVNDEFEFISGNTWFEELFNYSEKEHSDFDINELGQKYFNEDIRYKDQENVSCSVVLQKDGCNAYFILEKSPIYDMFHKRTGYFYIFRDITMRYEYEERLRELSEIDELSQLNNRKAITRFYDVDSKIVIEKEQSLAIFMMDLDYFKKYNDRYGHIEGDKVIQTLGKILRSVHNGEDIVAARYGGEEFFLIVKGKTMQEVEELAKMIMRNLEAEQILHEDSLVSDYVTTSIGISYYNKITEETLLGLIRKADAALYKAKEQGRNTYVLEHFVI